MGCPASEVQGLHPVPEQNSRLPEVPISYCTEAGQRIVQTADSCIKGCVASCLFPVLIAYFFIDRMVHRLERMTFLHRLGPHEIIPDNSVRELDEDVSAGDTEVIWSFNPLTMP